MALEYMCKDFARKLGISLLTGLNGLLKGDNEQYHMIRSINPYNNTDALTIAKKLPLHEFSVSYIVDYPGRFVQTALFVEIAHGCIDDYISQLEHSKNKFCQKIAAPKIKKRKRRDNRWYFNDPSQMHYVSFQNIVPRLFEPFIETMIPDLSL